MTASALQHGWKEQLSECGQTQYVKPQHGELAIWLDRREGSVTADARVVHQNVNVDTGVFNPVEQHARALVARKIHGIGEDTTAAFGFQRGGGTIEIHLASRHQHEIVTAPGKLPGQFEAKPFGAARDEDGATFIATHPKPPFRYDRLTFCLWSRWRRALAPERREVPRVLKSRVPPVLGSRFLLATDRCGAARETRHARIQALRDMP